MNPLSKANFSLAFITGSTSGIGEGLAKFFAEKGVPLFLTGRNKNKLQELKDTLGKKVPVDILAIDLSKAEDRKTLAKKVKELAPDLLINDAGISVYGEVLTYKTEDILNVIEVNINALVELTLSASRALVERKKKGVILNVSSVSAFFPMPGFATYAATKAFVNSFSEAVDFEVEKYGVRILATCPGVITSGFRERSGGKIDPEEQVMTVDYAVGEIWKQIESLKPLSIFNFRYRLLVFLSKYIIPKSFANKVIYSRMKKITPPRDLVL